MSLASKAVYSALLFGTLLVPGCALPPSASHSIQTEVPSWRGRLTVRVEADGAQSPAQAFAAGFELSGDANTGALTFFTPLGSTVASLSWSTQGATLTSNTEVRQFESLDALIKQTVGTELPVAALFAWLTGDNLKLAGWSADLSQQANGRITARRTQPEPPAELRLVIEQ